MITIIRELFFSAGEMPFIGALSLAGLLVFAMITSGAQLRRPKEKRDPKVFVEVMRWQFLLFLLTHTAYVLIHLGWDVRKPPEVDCLMRCVTIAFVGLAVEIPACIVAGAFVCVTCRKCPIVLKYNTAIILLVLVFLVEYIAYNMENVSVARGWLRLGPKGPVVNKESGPGDVSGQMSK